MAFEHEESRLGLCCIGSPILEAGGRTALAAVSVTGPVGRFRPEAHAVAVRAAATGISSTWSRRRPLTPE